MEETCGGHIKRGHASDTALPLPVPKLKRDVLD